MISDVELADLAQRVAAEIPAAVALRHRLHADPRLSGREDDTAESALAALAPADGERVQRVAGTGRLLRVGPAEGPAVALRAELDGLPITEATGLDFASPTGVMHACGHDLHLAALVAATRALRGRHAERPLPCAALAVLQPREEAAPTGAGDVLADPAFRAHDVRAVLGAHVQPVVDRGRVSAAPGPVNAACDELTITVRGRGGHAAYPHRADDPVLALCQTVVALHHLVGRRVDPLHAAVFTVGRVDAGTASNVIPEVARAYATLRVLDEADREPLRAEIRRVVAGTAAAYGCAGEVHTDDNEPVLSNDPALVAALGPALEGLGLRHDVAFRSCGSDDFARYAVAGPAVMMFVGVAEGGVGEPGLHDARFAPPDELVGELALTYLAGFAAAARVLGR
jgi:amidohydrolase